jgi:hypothetical protein
MAFLEFKKPDVPWRPVISSVGSPCHDLAGFLHDILYSLVGKVETWVKKNHQLLNLHKCAIVEGSVTLASFDVGLFANVQFHQKQVTGRWHTGWMPWSGSGCHYGVFGVVPKNYIPAADKLDTKQDFFNNISSLRLIIKVNMKTETDGAIPFMYMLVIRKD